MSANGVVHIIDKVFLPDSGYTYASIKRTSTVSSGNGGSYSSSSSSSSSTSSSSSSSSSSRSSAIQSSRTSYRRTYTQHAGISDNFDSDNYGDVLPAFPQGSIPEDNVEQNSASETPHLPPLPHRKSSSHKTAYSSVDEDTTDTKNGHSKSSAVENNIHTDFSTNSLLSSSDYEPGIHDVYKYADNKNIYESYNPSYSSSRNNTSESRNSGTVFLSRETSYPSSSSSSHTYSSNLGSSGHDVYSSYNTNPSSYSSFSRNEESNIDNYSPSDLKRFDSDFKKNPIDGRSSSSSRSYSYSYSDRDSYGSSSVNSDKSSNPDFISNDSKRVNSIGPSSPNGERFSYVGHHYGEDVIGHNQGSSAIPHTAPRPELVERGFYSSRNAKTIDSTLLKSSNDPHSHGGRHKYKSYSRYFNTSGKPFRHHEKRYFSKSKITRSSNIPKTSVTKVSTKSKNKYSKPDSLSAYAFTEDDKYADGADFAESISPAEEVITQEEAMTQRKMRRKRHHRKGNRGKAKGNRPRAIRHHRVVKE